MKYCLLNIAYDNSFFGFQLQPSVTTVQGELLKALSPIGIKKIYGSSRTDSHVRSASTIIEMECSDISKVCRIVDSVKGIVVRGYFESDKFINLRHSLEKEYLYIFNGRLNKKTMQKTIREFLKGKVSGFSRDPGRKVILSKISFSIKNSSSLLLFSGKAFSWNFVRIAAETIIRRSEGKIDDEEWTNLLSGLKRSRYKGDANNLILLSTRPPFRFKEYKSKNLKAIQARIFQDFYWLAGLDGVTGDIAESLDFIEGEK
jgi:tRNA pseudouridine(38-40) synthase